MAEPTEFVIVVRTVPHGTPPIARLKRLLKCLRRSFGFRCVEITERQMAAFEHLGRKTIPATVVDIDMLRRGELSENTQRLDLLPGEKMELSEFVAEHERDAAKKRQKDGGKTAGRGRPKIGSGKLPGPITDGKKTDSRDRIGAVVGMSGKTYEKAKTAFDAAKSDPDAFGDLIEIMNTKSINAAHRDRPRLRRTMSEAMKEQKRRHMINLNAQKALSTSSRGAPRLANAKCGASGW